MAQFKVKAPDGKEFVVNAPEGATQADAIAYVQKNLYKPEKGPDPSEGGGTLQFGPFDTGIKTPQVVDRTLAGIGKAFSDLGMGAKQIGAGVADAVAPRRPTLSSLVLDKAPVTRVDQLRKEVEEQRRLDAPLMDTTAGTVGNIAGNVAIYAPTAFIPGANTITGSAAIGGLSGLLQPSTSTKETIGNTGLGAVTSAALPVTTTAYRVGKSFVEPLYESGRNAIVGRTLNSAAGADAAAAQARLASAGSLVKGSLPTVGEAAEVPSLAALQRTATAVSPNVANEMAARQLANNQARIEALQSIIGDRQVSAQAREAATEALYAAAHGKTANLTPELASVLERMPPSILAKAESLAKMAGKPLKIGVDLPARTEFVGGAVEKVAGHHGREVTKQLPGLVDAAGNPITRELPAQASQYSGKALHYIKMALDDGMNRVGESSLGDVEKRIMQGVKNDFLGAVEAQIPEYGAARTTFAAMSKPVNQSDVAKAILERSTGNIQGNMTPAAFNRALSDRTAQSALGRTNATLGEVFEPAQMATLDAIKQDLKRMDFANTAGRGVGSDTVQKLAYSNMMDRAGVPAFLSNFPGGGIVGNLAQRAGQVVYKDANEKLAEQLAMTMMNPKLAAELMKKATPSKGLLAVEKAAKKAMVPVGGLMPGLLTEYAE